MRSYEADDGRLYFDPEMDQDDELEYVVEVDDERRHRWLSREDATRLRDHLTAVLAAPTSRASSGKPPTAPADPPSRR